MTAFLLALLIAAPQPTEPDAPDRLALAALLLRDGHHGRAQAELAQVDEATRLREPRRFWTLTAAVLIRRAEAGEPAWTDAAKALLEALATPAPTEPERPSLHALLARCRAELAEWSGALEALDAIPAAERDASPELSLIEARALVAVDRRDEAYRRLVRLTEAHPELAPARRMLVYLLIEFELYRAAARAAETWADAGAPLDDSLALAESFRRGRAFPEALSLLERLALTHPADPRVKTSLARALADANQPLAGAELLARAALTHPDHALDAAELYRRAGRPHRALQLNALVPDQVRKVRQRLGILIDLERFEEAVALAERLARLDLDRDDLAYALAFAAFRTERYPLAERLLTRVTTPELFERAATLRATIARCEQDPAVCR